MITSSARAIAILEIGGAVEVEKKEAIEYIIEKLPFRQSKRYFKGIRSDDKSLFVAYEAFKNKLKSLKPNENNISDISKTLLYIYDVLKDDTTKILIIKSYIDDNDHNKALDIVDSESEELRKKYFRCIYLTLSNLYSKALDTYLGFINQQDFPELLSVIIENIDLSVENKIKISQILDTVTNRKNYTRYLKCINQYIRRLAAEDSVDTINKIDSLCDRKKINTFIVGNILFSQKKYDEYYEHIISNLDKIKTFFPLLQWMLIAAKNSNRELELLSFLNNKANHNKISLQLLDSVLESLEMQSSRLYRYDGRIDSGKTFNVMYCVNKNYLQGFLASAKSLYVNNSNIRHNLNLYAFIDSTVDYHDLQKKLDRIEIKASIYNIDNICQTDNMKTEYGLRNNHSLDKSAYYRIFGLDFLSKKHKIDSVIYLDSDTLVLSNIYDFFTHESQHPICGCLENSDEIIVQKSKEINGINTYVNSGVLKFNLSNVLFKDCLKKTIIATEQYDKLMLHDQCAINIGFKNNISVLPEKYNYMTHMPNFSLTNGSIKILHFTGPIKPWQPAYHDKEFLSNLWFSYHFR